MATHKSLWTAPALSLLLISGVTAATLAAPTPGYAAKKTVPPGQAKKTLILGERVNVRMDEEKRLASLDKSYAKQMKALARQCRKTARAVEKQGNDSTALRAVAAYYDDQAKTQEKKEKKEKKVK